MVDESKEVKTGVPDLVGPEPEEPTAEEFDNKVNKFKIIPAVTPSLRPRPSVSGGLPVGKDVTGLDADRKIKPATLKDLLEGRAAGKPGVSLPVTTTGGLKPSGS